MAFLKNPTWTGQNPPLADRNTDGADFTERARQKYTLSDDQKASADIIADALTRDGQLYYYICIHLSSENRMSQDFSVLVDPDTGHITPIL